MAMYEVVFRRSGRPDDVVITNADPRAEGHVMIHGERWEVVKADPGPDGIEARLTMAVVSTGA